MDFMQALKKARGALQLIPGAEIYQKFTCEKCQERQTIPEANQWHTHATCEECKHLTDIYKAGCGFALLTGPNTRTPRVITIVVSEPYDYKHFPPTAHQRD